MLASGAAMTCMMRGSISEILATNDGKNLMRQAMAECGGVAAREGYALSVEDAQQLQTRLLDEKSNWVASMMRDISQRAPRIEAFEIVGEMIKRAERHQFDVPLLRLAYCHLEVYQRQRLDGPNGIAL
jgi:2-dehydropantoate 2-reductase